MARQKNANTQTRAGRARGAAADNDGGGAPEPATRKTGPREYVVGREFTVRTLVEGLFGVDFDKLEEATAAMRDGDDEARLSGVLVDSEALVVIARGVEALNPKNARIEGATAARLSDAELAVNDEGEGGVMLRAIPARNYDGGKDRVGVRVERKLF